MKGKKKKDKWYRLNRSVVFQKGERNFKQTKFPSELLTPNYYYYYLLGGGRLQHPDCEECFRFDIEIIFFFFFKCIDD